MSSRARNKLTAEQVAELSKPGVYSDGGGLYLRVRPPSRNWLFIGTFEGKRIELGLGSDLDVSLAKARMKAEFFRGLVLDGIDPRIDRRAARERAKANREASAAKAATAGPMGVTFGTFTKNYLAEIDGGFKNPKHRQQWRNTLATYAQPLNDIPISQVSTDEVKAILLPIWLSKPETASRVRGRIERILDAAKASGHREGENPARWRGHLELLLPKQDKARIKHHPALPYKKIADFMGELRSRSAVAARALEFAILTAARSGELRGMRWAELNLEEGLWTVPKERMKASKEHVVPLSSAALAIAEAFKDDKTQPQDFVFVAPRGGPLSDMALSELLKRMGHGDITVHGFRSTFRDWAGDATQFAREEVEMALAHTLTSKTEAAYRRGTALDKRRELMAEWAEYCRSDGPKINFKSNRLRPS